MASDSLAMYPLLPSHLARLTHRASPAKPRKQGASTNVGGKRTQPRVQMRVTRECCGAHVNPSACVSAQRGCEEAMLEAAWLVVEEEAPKQVSKTG